MNRPDHPYLAFLTIALGAWLFILSGIITNIALPRLTDVLGVAEADIVWITVAFQLAAVSCTIPLAGLSELVGIRNMFVGGLVVFAIGSTLCGVADDFAQLTAARGIQGLGAAGISSVNAALLRRVVSERMLGRSLGLLAIIIGGAQAAAPIVGSFLLEVATWRWIFLHSLPITFATIALALHALPGDQRLHYPFDYLSAALCVPMLGLGFFSIDRLARDPANTTAIALFGLAVLCGVMLVRRQKGRERPLFPIDLFVIPAFILRGAVAACTFGAQALALTALPFLFVSSLGMSILEAGALISFLPLAMLATVPLSGYLPDRFPSWPISSVGCFMMFLAFIAIYIAGETPDQSLLIGCMLLLGSGFAFFQSHNARAMILAAPAHRMGPAGGIQSTSRVVGQMVGPALVGISFHLFGTNGTAISMLMGATLALAGATFGLIASLYQKANRVGKI